MVCVNPYLCVLRYTFALYVARLVLCPTSLLTLSASPTYRAAHLGHTVVRGNRELVQGLQLPVFQFLSEH